MKPLYLALLLAFSPVVFANESAINTNVLPEREQAQLIDELLQQRLTQILPPLMQRENIDMWLLISREYNEDPVLKTMLPATWLSARRRTMLVIFNPGAGKAPELYAVARYDVGTAFKKAWDVEKQPDQWQALADLIRSKKPKRIGINQSASYGHADGMVATELDLLKQAIAELLAGELQGLDFEAASGRASGRHRSAALRRSGGLRPPGRRAARGWRGPARPCCPACPAHGARRLRRPRR